MSQAQVIINSFSICPVLFPLAASTQEADVPWLRPYRRDSKPLYSYLQKTSTLPPLTPFLFTQAFTFIPCHPIYPSRLIYRSSMGSLPPSTAYLSLAARRILLKLQTDLIPTLLKILPSMDQCLCPSQMHLVVQWLRLPAPKAGGPGSILMRN